MKEFIRTFETTSTFKANYKYPELVYPARKLYNSTKRVFNGCIILLLLSLVALAFIPYGYYFFIHCGITLIWCLLSQYSYNVFKKSKELNSKISREFSIPYLPRTKQ